MELLPPSVAATIPGPRAQEKVKDPICYVKLFSPTGMATWWLTEYDPKDRVAFGYCLLNDPRDAELGYVSIEELEGIKVLGVLGIERDINWTPQPLSVVKQYVRDTYGS